MRGPHWVLAVVGLGLILSSAIDASDYESDPEQVQVGHWVEVLGHWTGKEFRASRTRIVEPKKKEELIGILAPAPRTFAAPGEPAVFMLLGLPIYTAEKTEWQGIDPRAIVGQRIEIKGHYRSRSKFSAREISPRGGDQDRIIGPVDAVERSSGGIEITIMHYTVLLPEGSRVGHELPLERLAVSSTMAGPAVRISKGEEDLFGEGFALSDSLRFDAQLEFRSATQENLDLDDGDREDRSDYNGSVRARLEWLPSERVSAVGELRMAQRYRDDEEDGTSRVDDVQVGETFLRWQDLAGGSVELQIGRQDFDEQREWLYDQNLDGLRLVFAGEAAQLELSASTSLSDARQRDLDATNYMAYLSNRKSRRHFAVYAIHRDFDLDLHEQTTHVGVRALGRWLPRQEGWLELAALSGELGGLEVEGWAADLGSTWSSKSSRPAWLTLGYAYGSGDRDPSDGIDRTFRQTGLQDNNDKFGGVTSFRYYGELVEPELANLHIWTIGVGKRLARRTSIDFVLHGYRQVEARDRLFGTELDDRPTGLDPDLGLELDAIFGWRRLKEWDLEIVGAYFRPGDAFRRPDDAFLAKAQLRYRF